MGAVLVLFMRIPTTMLVRPFCITYCAERKVASSITSLGVQIFRHIEMKEHSYVFRIRLSLPWWSNGYGARLLTPKVAGSIPAAAVTFRWSHYAIGGALESSDLAAQQRPAKRAHDAVVRHRLHVPTWKLPAAAPPP
ncbi:uncharacterized protein LOC142814320 [Rhipicephalus microplus]|uniref:uncharacterized protein LOC142814320 n=1 Tax=Rhipicephalus microplus TaxID=6941 RepID=UPI003F6D57D1